ncbi:hypothetical protein ACPA3B_24265 [Bacillus bombysepticus]
MKQELILFIEEMEKMEDSIEILESIFDNHLKKTTQFNITELESHISMTFQADPTWLLSYIIDDSFNDYIELDFKNPFYKCIHKLKLKYGFFLQKSLSKDSLPFVLSSTEVNVQKRSTLHPIIFKRTDGVEFKAYVNADMLLGTLGTLAAATKGALEKGIYSLDREEINTYLSQTNELIDFLFNLMKEPKQKTKELTKQ